MSDEALIMDLRARHQACLEHYRQHGRAYQYSYPQPLCPLMRSAWRERSRRAGRELTWAEVLSVIAAERGGEMTPRRIAILSNQN